MTGDSVTDSDPDSVTPQMRACFDLLLDLLGTWRGRGTGRYPTIDDFEYEEETVFSTRGEDELALHYQQRTWLLDGNGGRQASHWESGFFQVRDDARVEVLNAQLGRVEVLVGDAHTAGEELRIELVATVHGHDPRLVTATRELSLTGDTLRYRTTMSTQTIATAQTHLRAELERV